MSVLSIIQFSISFFLNKVWTKNHDIVETVVVAMQSLSTLM